MRHLPLASALIALAAAQAMTAQSTGDRPGALLEAEALSAQSIGGVPTPQAVEPPASFALNLDGDVDLQGFIFQNNIPFLHNEGGASYGNTALGVNALESATPSGPYFGSKNSAFGSFALRHNTGGHSNTAGGYRALYYNDDGYHNTASGSNALYSNSEGDYNTASGYRALFNNTGSYNTAIGAFAGVYWNTGQDNIAIGWGALGNPAESGVIRIGGGDNQDQTFIEGISNAAGVFDDHDVCIEGDQLGPCSVSSARFKQDIEPLGDLSRALAVLRPVSFRYKEEFASGEGPQLRYGLIAEDVAEVLPSLVTTDETGRPHTVRYDLLTPLLLAEIQRQEAEIVRQKEELAELRRQMADRDRVVADLSRTLEKLAKQSHLR